MSTTDKQISSYISQLEIVIKNLANDASEPIDKYNSIIRNCIKYEIAAKLGLVGLNPLLIKIGVNQIDKIDIKIAKNDSSGGPIIPLLNKVFDMAIASKGGWLLKVGEKFINLSSEKQAERELRNLANDAKKLRNVCQSAKTELSVVSKMIYQSFNNTQKSKSLINNQTYQQKVGRDIKAENVNRIDQRCQELKRISEYIDKLKSVLLVVETNLDCVIAKIGV